MDKVLPIKIQMVTCDGQATSHIKSFTRLNPWFYYTQITFLILSKQTKCAIFADGTKIYRDIHDQSDALQEDIDKVAQ